MAFIAGLTTTSSLTSICKPATALESRYGKPHHIRRTGQTGRATIRAEAPIEVKQAWVDAILISDMTAGTLKSAIVTGLDICLACDYDGQVYAVGNKGPPLGLPLSDGSIVQDEGGNCVKCAQYRTLFDLRTGQVRDGLWIRSPVLVSNLLRMVFPEPGAVPTYGIREKDDMLQVLVDVNARANYEVKYWKGLLDATGKADGSYY